MKNIMTVVIMPNIDGSWDPEEKEGDKHRINATILALRALKEYNVYRL